MIRVMLSPMTLSGVEAELVLPPLIGLMSMPLMRVLIIVPPVPVNSTKDASVSPSPVGLPNLQESIETPSPDILGDSFVVSHIGSLLFLSRHDSRSRETMLALNMNFSGSGVR